MLVPYGLVRVEVDREIGAPGDELAPYVAESNAKVVRNELVGCANSGSGLAAEYDMVFLDGLEGED